MFAALTLSLAGPICIDADVGSVLLCCIRIAVLQMLAGLVNLQQSLVVLITHSSVLLCAVETWRDAWAAADSNAVCMMQALPEQFKRACCSMSRHSQAGSLHLGCPWLGQ